MKLLRATWVSLLVATSLLLPACGGGGDGGGGPTEPSNRNPSASLSVSPTEGEAPLDVRISLTCSDPDGMIAEYRLDADGDGSFEVTRASAIETARVYEADVTVRGRCADDDGGLSSEVSRSVDVLQPAFLRAGRLEDDETDTGRPGEIRVYAESDTSLVATITTSADGSWERTELSDLQGDAVLIQAMARKDGEQASYVRTIRAAGGGTVGPEVIRVVPFDGLAEHGIGTGTFVDDYVLPMFTYSTAGLQPVRRWNLDGLEGVYIFESHPLGRGRFSLETRQRIADLWSADGGVPAVVGRSDLNVVIGSDSDTDAPFVEIEGDRRGIRARRGWIVIARDTTLAGEAAGVASPQELQSLGDTVDGRFDRGYAIFLPAEPRTGLLLHEIGHVVGLVGHPERSAHTVMSGATETAYGFVDRKVGHILYEPTFPPLEAWEDVLGAGFFRQR